MSAHVMPDAIFHAWATEWANILIKPVPSSLIELDETTCPQYRTKKVVLKGLTRIIERYGNIDYAPEDGQEFAKGFIHNVAGQFVGIAYQVLSTRLNGGYLPGRITQFCCKYLEYTVGISTVYKQLKPNVEPLLCGLIFPMLCFNDEDQELWDNDPQEYVRKSTDPFTEYVNPQVAAVNLLIMITKQRPKDSLNMYLTFLNNVLVQYSQAPGVLEHVRRKDGALFSIGAMYEKLSKKKDYKGPIEQLLINQVLPEFQSPHGFMRTRACWTVSMYTQFEYSDPNTRVLILQAVANCLRDPELPVRVAAGMGLKLLLVALGEDEQDVADVLRPVLPQLLEAFLALMNDIDNEDLIACLEIVVMKFEDAIGPYAVQLCTQLGNAYLRLAVDGGDDDDEFASAMAAAEAIHTLNTILASCVKQPQVFVALEPLIVRVVVQSLEEYNIEYLEEALEMLTLHTYAVPEISPTTWQLLPMLHVAFKAHASSFIEFFVGVIDNYISRAPDAFLANPTQVEILRQMVCFVLEHPTPESVELRSAAELIQVLFNNCKGKADAALLPFFTPLVTRLSMKKTMSAQELMGLPILQQLTADTVTKVEMIATICSGLYYSPILMLQMMESQGWTQGIFMIWNALHNEDKLKRRKDKKMSLLGLGAVLSLDSAQLPATIQAMLPGLVNMSASICIALDELPEPGAQGDFDGYEEDGDGEDDDGELDDDEDYGGKTDAVVQQMIQDKIQAFKDGELDEDEEDDSDWEEFDDCGEEEDDESPLSVIEPTVFFRQMLEANANAQQLLAQLDAEGQARVAKAFAVAEKRGKAHQEALASAPQ